MVSSKIIYVVGQINIVKVVHSESWAPIPDTAKNFPTYLSMSTMSINQFFMETKQIDSIQKITLHDRCLQREDIWMKYDIFTKNLVLQKISQAMQWFGEDLKQDNMFWWWRSNKKWQAGQGLT